jgi:threonyl-tRNA synthetase
MIHRVVFGSIERFIGILIEHFAGAFPLWLAPMQAVVLPISERQLAYAKEVGQKLKNAGLRVEVDERSEKIGYKIREAQLKKVPYMLVVGDKEAEAQAVSVRERSGADKGAMPVMQFIEKALDEVSRRIQ